MQAGFFFLFILSCFDCDCSTFSTGTIAFACYGEVMAPSFLTDLLQTSSVGLYFPLNLIISLKADSSRTLTPLEHCWPDQALD